MKAVDKTRILRFYRENDTALISQHNAMIRVLENNEESFFRELTHAINYLFDKGYYIEHLLSSTYKYPEDNRF